MLFTEGLVFSILCKAEELVRADAGGTAGFSGFDSFGSLFGLPLTPQLSLLVLS